MNSDMKYTVFVIEDDEQIRTELAVLLARNGYEAVTTTRFDTVVDEIAAMSPDIVLLDLNLPCVDGHVICRELREKSEVPIIVVTSRNSDLDELMTMNLGADDFVTKPYSPHILLARMESILRRVNKGNAETSLSYNGIELDPLKDQVRFSDKQAELTRNEMRILQVLMQNAEQIVSRENLQHELWQSDQFVDDNTLTVNVNRLRTTLAKLGLDGCVHTKRGQGYYLEVSS